MKKFRFLSMSAASLLAVSAAQYFPATAVVNAASQDIYINEVCSQNKSCLTDSYGKHADWIEIYNAGSSAADISGYGLSDKKDIPLKWTFPSGTSVPAKGYLVVIASENETSGSELHTGFSLSKNGETLVMSTPDGTVFQEVNVPVLGEDDTYGRTPDGSTVLEIMPPTPAKKNAQVVSAPSFSKPSGFYDSSFSLSITAPAGTTVVYTLDGSNPVTSSTAQTYNGAINVENRSGAENIYAKYHENETNQAISRGCGYREPSFKVDKATVVRAAAKSSDGTFSKVTEQTYFIGSGGMLNYSDYTVISLVTDPENLFDPDKGIYVTGNQYIQWKNSSSYNPGKSVWDTDNISNFFSKGAEWERPAQISIFEKGTLALEENAGIRIKGASTRNTPQKSFNIFARSEYGTSKFKYALLPDNYSADGELIDRYDSFSVRSVSDFARLNDGFAQGMLYDRENLTLQRMKPCVVFLDGEFWGMYQITEKLSDYFIECNYGIPKQDVAMIKANQPEEGGEEECRAFLDFAEKYSAMDLTKKENYDAVSAFLDIDSFIEMYAAGLYLGTYDWPNTNSGAWRNMGEPIEGNPYSDGKWRFMTYDLDYTMGDTYANFGGVEGVAYDNFRHMDRAKKDAPTSLFVNLLKNSEFKAKFIAVYCDYINEVMTTEKANARIEKFSREYTDIGAVSVTRWWGFNGGSADGLVSYNRSQYQKRLGVIKNFFEKRGSNTLQHMKNYLGVSGDMQTITVDIKGKGKVKISSLYADGSGRWTGKYLSGSPVTLTAVPDLGCKFTGWSGDADGNSSTITVTLSEAVNITASFSEAADIKIAGDINNDGRVNSADVILLQKYFLGISALGEKTAADMDSNGQINIADLCSLTDYVLR